MTDDQRAKRIGKNEALFRSVNERLENVNQALGSLSERMQIVCECGQADCVDGLELTTAEYEELRSDPTTFAVKPGHEIPDVETVIARRERYTVVRKNAGSPAEVAARTDERT